MRRPWLRSLADETAENLSLSQRLSQGVNQIGDGTPFMGQPFTDAQERTKERS